VGLLQPRGRPHEVRALEARDVQACDHGQLTTRRMV
jgi:hypothetical protein